MLRLALAFVLLLTALPVLAQTDPRARTGGSAPNVSTPRTGAMTGNERITGSVLVGEHAPDFSLASPGGTQVRLKHSRGRWTALFFTDRRDDLPRLAELSATLDSLSCASLVVVHEKVQALVPWRSASNSTLTALSDDRGEIAGIYGVWDTERGAIRHGLFLLDPQGVVRVELLGQKTSARSLRALVQSAIEGL